MIVAIPRQTTGRRTGIPFAAGRRMNQAAATVRDEAGIEHLELEANGLRFHALASGPKDGPLVLLLHGFPEFSYGWRHQLRALGAAGLRAVAPDQRGYGRSDKPAGIRSYEIDRLAMDVVALAHALDHDRFRLVGHDWGGIVAWHLASNQPQALERLVILNAPHLGIVGRHALQHPLQLLKSSYVGFFQLPLVPELALTSWDCALLVSALERSSRPGTFTPDELKVYRAAWSEDGAMTTMLNWYRALALGTAREPQRIGLPVRVLWGDRDTALEPSLAEASLALCDDGEVFHFADATHWLQHEKIDDVNQHLVDFLKVERSARKAARTAAA